MENPFLTSNLVPMWTDALRILKGDFDGHPFRGNQYENESAETPIIQTRPPAGEFQFRPDELKQVARDLSIRNLGLPDDYPGGPVAIQGLQSGAVAMAKKLGFDKPAEKVTAKNAPTSEPLYRGCSQIGAKKLLETLGPTNAYQALFGSESTYGTGVYFGSHKTASEYANDPMGGVLVKGWINPNATILTSRQNDEAYKNLFDTTVKKIDKTEGLTKDEKFGLKLFANTPGGLAMLNGYQAYRDTKTDTTIVLDRSILKVYY
jgi:hypothetical protein